MRYVLLALAAAIALVANTALVFAGSTPEGFVLIPGAEFRTGTGVSQKGSLVRLDDFEILDHPVNNLEYKAFIDETGHTPPLHWFNGRIPQEVGELPVIFVNRPDVEAYLRWLSEKDKRVYRLPTSVEFEYAARGGLVAKSYP